MVMERGSKNTVAIHNKQVLNQHLIEERGKCPSLH